MGEKRDKVSREENLDESKPPWRERLWRVWREDKWFVIAGLWVLAVVLGYIGFSRYYSSVGESQSGWHIFYKTIQLFVLESGAVPGPLPWTLEVARLLAPAVAVFTVITVIAVVFYEQLRRVRMFFIKDHVIICGLGRKGLVLAKEFHKEHTVVVIEQDENNPMLEQCKGQGAIVLIGNAADPVMLGKAKVSKAKYLISVCGDEGINAEVAVNARELLKKDKGGVLTCLVHVVDLQLCSLVREQEMYMSEADNFRLEFFNVFEGGARALLNQHPVFDETGEGEELKKPHPLVVGIGRMGESVIVHAARRWSQWEGSKGERLRISLLDREAETKKESLCVQHPELDGVWELIPLQMDINSPEYQRAGFLFDSEGRGDITIIYICLDDDSRSLSAALLLLKRLPDYRVPIIVRMVLDAGLSNLLKGEMGDYAFSNLHAFGLLDRTCKPDLLFAGTHEVLARAIHEEYLSYRRRIGQTTETNPSMVPWDDLPEELRESNRRQAGHITVKLRTAGYAIAPLADGEAEPFVFSEDEVELMAEMEHEHWRQEKIRWGWRPGPKNLEEKTSPFLVPWDDLSEEDKEYDRESIRSMPSFLARAGFRIYRPDRENFN